MIWIRLYQMLWVERSMIIDILTALVRNLSSAFTIKPFNRVKICECTGVPNMTMEWHYNFKSDVDNSILLGHLHLYLRYGFICTQCLSSFAHNSIYKIVDESLICICIALCCLHTCMWSCAYTFEFFFLTKSC